MIHLDNELLTTERIIKFIEDEIEFLKKPEIDAAPSGVVQFQNKLRSIFFKKEYTNEAICENIDNDHRFSSYPKLKAVLKILLSLKEPSDIDGAIAQIKSLQMNDWELSPQKFNEYNRHYGYFPENPELQGLFENLTRSCRAQIVFFEQNNTEDDTLAYDYAYKLMTLFVNPDNYSIPKNLYTLIYRLMNSTEADKQHPLHQLFLVKLSVLPKITGIRDRIGWHRFIMNMKNMDKSLPFFQNAVEIEAILNHKAPKDLDEAKTTLLRLEYRRANEDMDFASLCRRYHVPEYRFNRCLDYIGSEWPKKKGDNIPDVTVKGTGIAENLLWVKLPIKDKRGLILGDITDCCQSIGGHSEDCVKDAMSLENNAIYVLLKRKSKTEKQAIENEQINDVDFKIIGQSYVWRSIYGNICLDSLECLKGEVSPAALQLSLSDLSQQILEKCPDIHHVTLGQGGKTPKAIFADALFVEEIREGVWYGDSFEQYCILSREPDVNDIEKFKQLFPAVSENVIRHFSCHLQQLNELLLTSAQASNHKQLFASIYPPENVIRILLLLSQMGLITQENVESNFSVFFKPYMLAVLTIFFKANLHIGETKQTNFDLLLKCTSPEVEGAMRLLDRTGLLRSVDAQSNLFLVLNHKKPHMIAIAIVILNKANIFDARARNLVLAHSNPDLVARMLKIRLDKPRLYSHASLPQLCEILDSPELLVDNREQFLNVTTGNPEPQNFEKVMSIFNDHDLLRFEDAKTMFHTLIKHENLNDVQDGFAVLDESGLLRSDNARAHCDVVMNHPKPYSAACALQILSRLHLLSVEGAQVYCNAVMKHQDPNSAATSLEALSDAHLLADTGRIAFDLILSLPFLNSVAQILQILSRRGLLNGEHAQKNIEAVINHQSPRDLEVMLKRIYSKKDWSVEDEQDYFNAFMRHESLEKIEFVFNLCFKKGLLRSPAGIENFEVVLRHDSPNDAASALKILADAKLLSENGFHVIRDAVLTNKCPCDAASASEILYSSGLLRCQEWKIYFDAVMSHKDPRNAASASKILYSSGLLRVPQLKTYCDTVMAHKNLLPAAYALEILHSSGLLSGPEAKRYFDAVMNHNDPENAASALKTLAGSKLLNGADARDNFLIVIGHKAPAHVAHKIISLYDAGLYEEENAKANLDTVMQMPMLLRPVIPALKILSDAHLLNGKDATHYRAAVMSHAEHGKSQECLSALKTLKSLGLLESEGSRLNFDAMMAHKSLLKVVTILNALWKKNPINKDNAQATFDQVLNYPDILALSKNLELLGAEEQHSDHRP